MKKTILSAFLFLILTANARADVYIVKKGDTLTLIAQKLGISIKEIKNVNPNINDQNLSIGERIHLPGITNTANNSINNGLLKVKTYTVKPGDNAFDIAKKLGCSLDSLKKLNPNINLSNLNTGDQIIIPNNIKSSSIKQGNVYIVRPGDTASVIASSFNISLSQLEKLNPQYNLSNLNVGDKIIIPSNLQNSNKNYQETLASLHPSIYTVVKGDTLGAISQKTKLTMDKIKRLNPSIDWSDLQIGEQIVLEKRQTPEKINKIPPDSSEAIAETQNHNNYIKYTVTTGDSLYSIATAFSTTIDTLKSINSLQSNNLSVGQVLLVPPKVLVTNTPKPSITQQEKTSMQTGDTSNDKIAENYYTDDNSFSLYLQHYDVASGDTLYTIAKKFDTSVDDIMALNNLPNSQIKPGMELLIPKNNTNNVQNNTKSYPSDEYSLTHKEENLDHRLVKYAKLFIGAPYQWGGTNLSTGVDCSGFVQDVFEKFHIDLPRTSSEQYDVGTPVSLADIKPGDLLFFQTYQGTYPSHVGIYIGNNRFISALNQNTGVVVSPLSGYFLRRFVGARRVLPYNERLNYSGNRPG